MPAVLRLLCPAVVLIATGLGALHLPSSGDQAAAPAIYRATATTSAALVPAPRPETTRKPAPVRPVKAKAATHQHLRASAKPAIRRTSARVGRPSPSAQQRLDGAIARIPGYPAGGARWVLEAKDGFWGTADWYRGTIYISPRVPANRLYDVVVHEWAHLLTVKVYNGDVELAKVNTNRYFGGSRLVGAEKAADCIARQLGARWSHYTTCDNVTWRAGAARLVAGEPL